jgi:hypothetical protein
MEPYEDKTKIQALDMNLEEVLGRRIRENRIKNEVMKESVGGSELEEIRLQWSGHAETMDKLRMSRMLLELNFKGKRSVR